ncbi:TonB-dependent receptor [Tunicatimonas pelagia]|uniref:TonB-dependent receptor n=1 Tax=Tunicatimonas pelagia TaxID=931531 RepID=UPI002665A070|nr:TonB-dependent receptor [Tunicatimonas pelagia]WKN44172.1 TonB-dependent receptor [Tunicatimonas pelagia]
MKKYLLVSWCLFRVCCYAHATQGRQFSDSCAYEIRGSILDAETQQPIPFATVMIKNTRKGVEANKQGKFLLENLCKKEYTLVCSSVGYENYRKRISLSEDTEMNVRMTPKMVSLSEVVVSANYEEQRKQEEALSLEIVNSDYLKQHQGGSLMNSLDRLAGVTTMDIGSGQSKPVIRGLGFNRVVVVENGIKHEGQQWGVDHGLEIDQYAVDNVEVIRGPSSLRYGSDAIGGVINVKQDQLPEQNTLSGTVDLTGKTNNNLLGTSISLAGRGDVFFATFRATLLDYGDYKVPTDSVDIYNFRAPLYKNHLRNTAGHEHDLHFSFGYTKPTFQSRFYVSNIQSKSGFFANAHGLEPRNVDEEFHDQSNRDIHYPYQQVNHFKVINKSQWEWKKYELKSEVGFQRNFRQEWSQYVSHGFMPAVYQGEEGFNPELERQFDKYVYSANVEGAYFHSDRTSVTVGVNGSYQDNRIGGRGFIIPAFRQLNVGSFVLARHRFTEKSTLQAGIRYDYGNTQIDSYQDWFTSPAIFGTDTTDQYLQRASDLNRNFSNVSWSIGYNYHTPHWSFKTNLGKSFRMPIAKELGANGVNYHRFSFEVGDPDLSPEVAYQVDAGLEYRSERFALGLTPFANYFSNYIYLNPTAEHDRLYGSGNQVFYYSQARVFRSGGEIHGHYQIISPLSIGLVGEYVYQIQLSGEKKGFTLPFSPPASVIFNLRYERDEWKLLKNPYVSVDYKVAASQTRIVPPEEVTDGYQAVNLGMGGEVKLPERSLSISLQVQNLFNTQYFNHTSFYRLINVPEPGRNFILNISIPFSRRI